MGTTKEDIRIWLEEADEDDRYMLVVCDTFDHEDYNVFVTKDMDLQKTIEKLLLQLVQKAI